MKEGTKLDTKKMTIEELEKCINDMDFDELRQVSSEVRRLQTGIEWRRMVLIKEQHKYSS